MCPQCQSTDVSRSKRKKLKDFFMVFARMRAYRCLQCRARFYLPASLERNIYREKAWRRAAERKRTGGRPKVSQSE